MIIKIYFITLIIIPFRLLKKEKVLFIVNELERLYPKTPIPLDHKDPYTLLIAVLLSAQSTDIGVNKITPILFEKADNPYDMVKLTVNQIRSIIKPVGLSPMKSKGIYGLSKILIEKFNGKVPNDVNELKLANKLPDVGSDVHAIGHPGSLSWTYTKGYVSQIRKNYKWNYEKTLHEASIIQTQTPISPGNSGGPLISSEGELLGVNSFKAQGENLNFAVTSLEVINFLKNIKKLEKKRQN